MTLMHLLLRSAAALLLSLSQPSGDAIPDFSRVGYHYGEDPVPDLPVTRILKAPKKGQDARALIQKAIDEMDGPGVLLLKAGTWNLDSTLYIRRSGIVLRGEGAETRLVATARRQYTLIRIAGGHNRVLDKAHASAITDEYTPVGQLWVRVAEPQRFRPGERVVIFRPGTEKWISDLHMDRIPPRPSGTRQWNPKEYDLCWERTVTGIDGDRILLDSPVVMGLDQRYGGGQLIPCSTERIRECGVERMALISEFDASVKDDKGRWTDEKHAWTGISISCAEHCWIRDVSSTYFGYSLFTLGKLCRNITAERCQVHMPVSIVTGSRRYAFNLSGAELCLVRDCSCDNDRHGCVTGARVCGPNVFTRCSGTTMWSDFGPHHRWSTGLLYDRIDTDYQLNCQDRDNWGSGHGWAGANLVFWNCHAKTIVCQSPWVSAQNWAVGCIGTIDSKVRKGITFENASRHYEDGQQRPKGIFHSFGKHVEPESLYEYQLSTRLSQGIRLYDAR